MNPEVTGPYKVVTGLHIPSLSHGVVRSQASSSPITVFVGTEAQSKAVCELLNQMELTHVAT